MVRLNADPGVGLMRGEVLNLDTRVSRAVQLQRRSPTLLAFFSRSLLPEKTSRASDAGLGLTFFSSFSIRCNWRPFALDRGVATEE